MFFVLFVFSNTLTKKFIIFRIHLIENFIARNIYFNGILDEQNNDIVHKC